MAVDMAVVTTAYSVASAMGASPKVLLSLFEAALVESGFRNLSYGDRDSLGYLQQRPSQGWPNPMDVPTATRSFVRRAMENERKYPHYTAGQLAQSVQRSAFPERYDQREREARELLARVAGPPWPNADINTGRPQPGGIPLIPGGNVADALGAIADGIRTMATGAVNVGGLAATLAKLALPTTIVRAVSGGVGIICIIIGVLIIGREL